MPIKFIGALMVVLSGALWGLLKSKGLKEREKSIENIITALGMLESEIAFSSHRLKYAMEHISRVCFCNGLFSKAAEKIGNMPVYLAWQSAVDDTKSGLGISEKDAEIIKILGSELGMSDKEQQMRSIKYVVSLLNEAKNDAHNEYVLYAKMYRSIGVFGGLFVAVLLL